jgi:hypothetical protein
MLQFRGSAVTSDAGFLVYCENDPAMRSIVMPVTFCILLEPDGTQRGLCVC